MMKTKDTELKKSFLTRLFTEEFYSGTRRVSAVLIAIFAFAFAIRLARSFQIDRIEKDAVAYIWMAEDINENGMDNAFAMNPRIPPLHIILIVSGMKLGLDPRLAGILISAISGALLIFPVFFIARRLFKTIMPSIISALVLAVYPDFVRLSSEILRDPLFYLFSSCAIWMIIESVKSGKSVFHLLAGLSVALAASTRSEGMEIIIAYVLFCSWEAIFPAGGISFVTRTRKILLRLIIFMIGFAVIAAPLEYVVSKTSSEWHVVDLRIYGYIKAVFNQEDDTGGAKK